MDNEHLSALFSSATPVQMEAGAVIYSIGDRCGNFLLINSGIVRVDLLTQTGKTIMLYRLIAGDTCVLTTACLLGESPYSASAHAETNIDALMFSADQFQQLIQSDVDFRAFVFRGFASRLALLIAKIEEVVFTPLDARLATRLLELAAGGNSIKVTHEKLAEDIASAREVVSRKLSALEAEGVVERGRGILNITDKKQLQHIAMLS